MNQARIKRIQSQLAYPVLIKKQENLLYLTGRSFMTGYLLVNPSPDKGRGRGEVVFFGDGLEHPHGLPSDQLKNIKKYLRPRATLFVEHYITVQELDSLKKFLFGVKIKTNPSLVEVLRMVKSTSELKDLTEAHRITASVFEIVKKQLRKKQWTEFSLAQYIRIWGLELGADEVSFAPIVAAGSNAAVPHHKPTGKILKPGESIILDFGFKVNGYCSDFSRTVFLKHVPKKLETIYLAVQAARFNAVRRARAGMTGGELDQQARRVLKLAKLEKYFIHSLGHGTGLEVHEAPSVSPNSKDVLQNGHVFSIEPGVYVPRLGGVRLEDLVYLDGGRAKYFVKVPTALEENVI